VSEEFFDLHFDANVKGLFFSVQKGLALIKNFQPNILEIATGGCQSGKMPDSLPHPFGTLTPLPLPPFLMFNFFRLLQLHKSWGWFGLGDALCPCERQVPNDEDHSS
jgi:hypothetical protein